jgi:hypothetical protein
MRLPSVQNAQYMSERKQSPLHRYHKHFFGVSVRKTAFQLGRIFLEMTFEMKLRSMGRSTTAALRS